MINITIPDWDVVLGYTQIKDNAPYAGGCYVLYGKNDEVLYIGKAKSLHPRLHAHFSGGGSTSGLAHYFYKATAFFEEDPMLRDIYETYLINTLKPKFNEQKVFLFKQAIPARHYKHRYTEDDTERMDPLICKGIKPSGERCNIRIKLGDGYCYHHKKYARGGINRV